MRSPFPGMDPWLEHPDLWPDVHNRLIVAICDALASRIKPRYVARVESRTTLLSSLDVEAVYGPDVAIRSATLARRRRKAGVTALKDTDVKPLPVIVPIGRDEVNETFLNILEASTRKLVTVIEILSPTNKKTKDARAEYLEKRRHLLLAKVNFVEIDLLRGGKPMPLLNAPPSNDYRILVCRPRRSPTSDLFEFSLSTPIPTIPIPLLPDDAEPNLELNKVLHALYARAGYDLSIDYRKPPLPPLRGENQSWAATLLARAFKSSPQNGS
jgi:Protein of unknown function (DUF4058)